MKWMKFTVQLNDNTVYLNLALAEAISPATGGSCIKFPGDENFWCVTETPEEIGQRSEWRTP